MVTKGGLVTRVEDGVARACEKDGIGGASQFTTTGEDARE